MMDTLSGFKRKQQLWSILVLRSAQSFYQETPQNDGVERDRGVYKGPRFVAWAYFVSLLVCINVVLAICTTYLRKLYDRFDYLNANPHRTAGVSQLSIYYDCKSIVFLLADNATLVQIGEG